MSGNFDHGLDLEVHTDPLGFAYGSNCTGPTPELRYLDDIRATLLDPECTGPDIAYAIVMDIAPESVRDDLRRRNLCFGVVTYAAGRLGREPVRSQGHVHKRSPHTGISTPEVYEVWSGRAVILMQEHAAEDPGRCFAVAAEEGDVVVVPPGWVHATISADPTVPLTFGAWCDADYGFEYEAVRAHRGLAWFPVLDGDQLTYESNPSYLPSELIEKSPSPYGALGIAVDTSIWHQYIDARDRFDFVPDPRLAPVDWEDFIP